MNNPDVIPDEKTIWYMGIGNKEHQDRIQPLKPVKEFVRNWY